MTWQIILKRKKQGKKAIRSRVREAVKEYINNHVDFDEQFRTHDIVIDWEEIEVDKTPTGQHRSVGKQLKHIFDMSTTAQMQANGYYLERVNLKGSKKAFIKRRA
tara:strand:+ start:127 stop:441 length:315 start_codon:yes stop_codon:yes gene_type:complete